MKKALCIGINNYPGFENDLNGCINDANDWTKLYQQFGFEVTTLLDSAARKLKIKTELQSMIWNSQAGDVLVVSYSGHGTSIPDTSGDEADFYDEALYVYDGAIIDDELRDIFKSIPYGVQMIVILDSCFSGTATRVLLKGSTRKKYLELYPIPQLADLQKRKEFLIGEDMKEILLAGCGDDEYSYDAYINGRYNGAFTRYAIDTIRGNFNYEDFMNELRKKLPSREYPQTPQLDCSVENAYRILFTPSVDSGVDEPDLPTPP
ncbi:MAG TPA: caspase family protein, partial [bacterium]